MYDLKGVDMIILSSSGGGYTDETFPVDKQNNTCLFVVTKGGKIKTMLIRIHVPYIETL